MTFTPLSEKVPNPAVELKTWSLFHQETFPGLDIFSLSWKNVNSYDIVTSQFDWVKYDKSVCTYSSFTGVPLHAVDLSTWQARWYYQKDYLSAMCRPAAGPYCWIGSELPAYPSGLLFNSRPGHFFNSIGNMSIHMIFLPISVIELKLTKMFYTCEIFCNTSHRALYRPEKNV